jgi:2-polyprenyl-3-methyl-5-hydroxy-6-metoxy-1,4-benzoquinol methylase
MSKPYNTTDLSPDAAFERHVFHRDQFAHYLRWTHILKEAKIGESIVDFGCGQANLLEVLYRNKFKQKSYVGIDIREKTIEAAKTKFRNVDWAEFYVADLVHPCIDLSQFNGDKVCCFEVLEHVGKQNADAFLEGFKACGNNNATYYLSTPNYDPRVGAAGNHTYDSGDGRGVDVQEFGHWELEAILNKHFQIVKKFGTFASVKDYKPLLNSWQKEMYNALKDYYDSNLIANIMAPMFPDEARNTLWVLKRKPGDYKPTGVDAPKKVVQTELNFAEDDELF